MAEEHKKRLLKALGQSDKANSGVVQRGQEFVDSSRLQLDLNQSIRGALQDMTDESLSADQWKQWTDGIVAQTVQADIAYRQMEEVQLFTLSTSANTSTASTTASAYIMGHGGAWSVVGHRPAVTAAQVPLGVLRLRDSVQVV